MRERKACSGNVSLNSLKHCLKLSCDDACFHVMNNMMKSRNQDSSDTADTDSLYSWTCPFTNLEKGQINFTSKGYDAFEVSCVFVSRSTE